MNKKSKLIFGVVALGGLATAAVMHRDKLVNTASSARSNFVSKFYSALGKQPPKSSGNTGKTGPRDVKSGVNFGPATYEAVRQSPSPASSW